MQYTLSNDTLNITVNSLGAELQSLLYLPKKLEFLWQGNKEHWARQAPILFPIVGKLKNNQLKYNNKTYPMSQHGFARDSEFKLISQNETEITLQLQANNFTKAQYPFYFELTVTFRLSDQTLTTTYQVYNRSEKTLPFSLGGHPAFNWPLMHNVNKQDYQIVFNKTENDKISQLEQGLIKQEKTMNPMVEKILALNESLFLNDALIFEKIKSDKIRFECISATHNAFVEMNFADFNDFGIWTKPRANFVCLEPWLGYSSYENFDGDFSKKPGILNLNADETAAYSFEIKVGID